jgi:hypothetical protein
METSQFDTVKSLVSQRCNGNPEYITLSYDSIDDSYEIKYTVNGNVIKFPVTEIGMEQSENIILFVDSLREQLPTKDKDYYIMLTDSKISVKFHLTDTDQQLGKSLVRSLENSMTSTNIKQLKIYCPDKYHPNHTTDRVSASMYDSTNKFSRELHEQSPIIQTIAQYLSRMYNLPFIDITDETIHFSVKYNMSLTDSQPTIHLLFVYGSVAELSDSSLMK